MVSVVKYRNSLLRPTPSPYHRYYRNGELGTISILDGPIHFVVGTGKCRRDCRSTDYMNERAAH